MPFTQVTHFDSVSYGLKELDKVFNKQHIQYRVLGSVLVAALNGKPHRILGDIDVLVDEDGYREVVTRLKTEGYVMSLKHSFGFHWTEAHREGSLGFTFLLVGKFFKEYFLYSISKYIELRILRTYLEATTYSLLGTSFIGIPLRSIYEGLKISNLNPKRKLDRKVVTDYLKGSIPSGVTLDRAFSVFVFGIELPYIYKLFSELYNLYGSVRVRLGKRYEVWD